MLPHTQNSIDFIAKFQSLPSFLIFLIACFLAIAIGRLIAPALKIIFTVVARKQEKNLYELFIRPIQGSIKVCTTLLLIYWAAKVWLVNYKAISTFLEIITSLVFFSTTAWMTSRVLKQFIRVYGIKMLRNSGFNINEILLVLETLANIFIGMMAIILYAESRDFPWLGIFAGVSLGGAVLGLAASKAAEDFLSTLLLYFDNRFLPGEYVRLPPMEGRVEEVFGRVESIGWRSTTIRIAGKNTIYITPNTMMAQQEIENVSRGKRIMVLLNLCFSTTLNDREKALIEEIVLESTDQVYGIAANSTRVKFTQAIDGGGTNASIHFAILGSTESSIRLRKDILESACEEVANKLRTFNIQFVTQESKVYIEAPITV
jgi:small-conductance mechanosensitive channel